MKNRRWSTKWLIVAACLTVIAVSIGCPPQQQEGPGVGVTHSSAQPDKKQLQPETGPNKSQTPTTQSPSGAPPNPSDTQTASTQTPSTQTVSTQTHQANAEDNAAGHIHDSGDRTSQPEVVQSNSASSHTDEAQAQPSSEPPKEYEPLFVGWEKPVFAMLVSGRQDGYIEPCGCTGLSNQKGGLMRRHTLMKQIEEKGWPLTCIDAGNQIRRFGVQPMIKFSRTVQSISQVMNYQAVAWGPDDLRLPSIDLLQAVENNKGDINPFVCANVSTSFGDYFPRIRVISVGGKKIGITSIFGDEFHELIISSDIECHPAAEGLRETWPLLKNENCDYYVLLAHTSLEKSRELAHQFPYFDLLVTAGGVGEPTLVAEKITTGNHTTEMVQVGTKGMYVGVVGFYEAGERLRYQRVPLDDRFVDSEPIKKIFKEYQDELKAQGLDGLSVRPVAHPTGRKYVGSEACGDCHTIAYDIWKNGVDGKGGPHYHATKSLVEPGERTWVQRHYDPECLSCHVTGWNPQKFFPYDSGYLDLEASHHMHGNGCENCHGPGSQHVAAENGDIDADDEQMQKFRLEMRVTVEQARDTLCMTCHDLDNSPDFHTEGAFEKYWARIIHEGVD